LSLEIKQVKILDRLSTRYKKAPRNWEAQNKFDLRITAYRNSCECFYSVY